MSIQILNPNLINKIAAGEVVERPASVLRELLENAIDAKSTRIEIFLEQAGIKKLTIRDNGKGMSEGDLARAILRHATSKIISEADLFSISTLGFRGEALPSIGSVSKFTISSRLHDQELGYLISLEGGDEIRSEPVAMNPGTEVVVEDLFYNVPVRKKFLKREQTEYAYLYDVLTKVVLFYHNITFILYKNGKKVKHFPAQESKKRMLALFGEVQGKKLYPIVQKTDALELNGFLGKPDIHHRTSKNISIFINGRFIRDKVLIHAISHGYRSFLEQREYPMVILFLQIDPTLVDVNVHPQKMEVRFNDSRMIHTFIARTIEQVLAKTPWVQDELGGGNLMIPENAPTSIGTFASPEGTVGITPADYFARGPQPFQGGDGLFSGDMIQRTIAYQEQSFMAITERGYFSRLKVVGQIHKCYILCEDQDGLVVIDQHAAHERIGYEILLENSQKQSLQTETLLVPLVINFEPDKLAILTEHLSFFTDNSFEVELFGGDSIMIRKVPYLFKRGNIESLIREVVDEFLYTGFSLSYDERMKKIYATMACHSVVRSGDQLNLQEMEALLTQMDQFDFSANCPHGRPVYFKLGMMELEKRFHRR